MNTAKPVRCALYLRVSTEEQATENQRPELEQLVRARGFEVVIVYEEQVSAAKARPVFKAMLDDARRGAFDVVLVWAVDRLGRSMVGNLSDVLELDRIGVQVVSVREPWLDTGGPVRDFLLAIFSWCAEQERRRLVERTKAGLERVRQRGSKSGKPIGRPRRFDGATLARALSMRQEGRSVRSIAMALRISRPTVQRALAAAATQTGPWPGPSDPPDPSTT